MQTNKNNGSLFFLTISVLSGIATITDFVWKIIAKNKIEFSVITLIGIIIFVLSLFVFFLKKFPTFRYNIIKNIRFLFHFSEAYEITNKISEYIIIDRTKMEHIKTQEIKSKVAQLCTFDDKFNWSKPQDESELEKMMNSIDCEPDNSHITTSRVENWIKYTVKLNDNLGKGDKEKIKVSIKNLSDPNQKSLPFLSGNTIVKTKELTLRVVFKDSDINPRNAKYKIFSNYASEYPIITRKLEPKINADNSKTLSYTELKPIPGYRYVIYWEY